MKFIPYGRHYIDGDDIKAVIEVLMSDFITQGPKIKEFEEALADYCRAKYAVCFNSGTSALHAAYFALGLKEGDEFITTPISFVATANAGLYLGARPVFCDVEEDTGNINADLIEEKITPRTKLISVVHYAGHPVDMRKVKEVADRHGLKVVEDACHALGASYRGEKVGSCTYSDATVFSFHPVKHITTIEGGAVLTNDENVYRKLLMFRNHGITKDPQDMLNKPHGDWYYEMQFLGYNYRFSDVQAALGLSQLKKLPFFVKRRREIASIYNEAFKNSPYFYMPVEKDYATSSYHIYVIRLRDKFVERKREIFDRLRAKGLGIQVHYIPIYLHPFYQSLGYSQGLCPVAEDFYKRAITLPLFPSMREEEITYVINTVCEVFNELTE